MRRQNHSISQRLGKYKYRYMKLNWTQLMYASYTGDVKQVNKLLQDNANPNLRNSKGLTALMLATVRGHTEIVEALK